MTFADTAGTEELVGFLQEAGVLRAVTDSFWGAVLATEEPHGDDCWILLNEGPVEGQQAMRAHAWSDIALEMGLMNADEVFGTSPILMRCRTEFCVNPLHMVANVPLTRTEELLAARESALSKQRRAVAARARARKDATKARKREKKAQAKLDRIENERRSRQELAERYRTDPEYREQVREELQRKKERERDAARLRAEKKRAKERGVV